MKKDRSASRWLLLWRVWSEPVSSLVTPLSFGMSPHTLFCCLSLARVQQLIISGAGPIGLVTLLAAHAAGCTPIVITDLVASRLEFAKTLVPTVHTLLLNRTDSPEANSERIKNELGMMPRVALECTGFESSIRAAIYVSCL
jgi:threonine dehydrogenase-like Zn-dependent dehydrogenase